MAFHTRLTSRCTSNRPTNPYQSPTQWDKVRYLSFAVPGADISMAETALQVKLVSLMHPNPANLPQSPPPNFTAFEGQARYVGAPADCVESESPPSIFKCAHLQCAPVYMDWNAALAGQALHVT